MGGLGTIITIILVVAWVVKGLASAVGNEGEGQKRPGRSLEEWDRLQAQRRAQQMSDQQEALSEMRTETSAQNPAQMTMAQRIELARQRARQQAGLSNQDESQAEALQRAKARAERQAQEQRQEAEQLARRQRMERERAAQQQRAQQERIKVQRRREAQQQAEQQAQRQRRTKQPRRTPPRPARATTGSSREGVVNASMQRVHEGHDHAIPTVTRIASPAKATGTAAKLGTLSRGNLRKAFIMKELLDKPVALRDPQADLLS